MLGLTSVEVLVSAAMFLPNAQGVKVFMLIAWRVNGAPYGALLNHVGLGHRLGYTHGLLIVEKCGEWRDIGAECGGNITRDLRSRRSSCR